MQVITINGNGVRVTPKEMEKIQDAFSSIDKRAKLFVTGFWVDANYYPEEGASKSKSSFVSG